MGSRLSNEISRSVKALYPEVRRLKLEAGMRPSTRVVDGETANGLLWARNSDLSDFRSIQEAVKECGPTFELDIYVTEITHDGTDLIENASVIVMGGQLLGAFKQAQLHSADAELARKMARAALGTER